MRKQRKANNILAVLVLTGSILCTSPGITALAGEWQADAPVAYAIEGAEEAKESERLAAEEAARESERLAAEEAARESERLAAEEAARESERLAAEEAARESERLAAEEAARESERLAAEEAETESECFVTEENTEEAMTEEWIIGEPETEEMIGEEQQEEETEVSTQMQTEEKQNDITLTASSGYITAFATFAPDVLPEDAVLLLRAVDAADVTYAEQIAEYDELAEEEAQKKGSTVTARQYFDISFANAQGEVIEPDGTVTVTMEFIEPVTGDEIHSDEPEEKEPKAPFEVIGQSVREEEASVEGESIPEWMFLHMKEESGETQVENLTDESQIETTVAQDAVTGVMFERDSFSFYVIVNTVNTEPEKNVDPDNWTEFKEALENGKTVILTSDVTVPAVYEGAAYTLTINDDATLILNGYTLTIESGRTTNVFNITGSHTFTVCDAADIVTEQNLSYGNASTQYTYRDKDGEVRSGSKTAGIIKGGKESRIFAANTGAKVILHGITFADNQKVAFVDRRGLSLEVIDCLFKGNGSTVIEVNSIAKLSVEASYFVENTTGADSLVRIINCAATICDTVFSGNTGNGNGALNVEGAAGKIAVKGSVLSNNRAKNGGAIRLSNHADLTLEDTVVRDNKAENGGGIYAGYPVTIALNKGVFICKNEAINGNGGGIFAQIATMTMAEGCTIRENKAKENGGGIFLNGLEKEQSFTMSGGAIEKNEAKNGGGIACAQNVTLQISGSALISENQAVKQGGGIYCSCGNDKITFRMSGGTICKNKTDTDASMDYGAGFGVGGGGIRLEGNTDFTLSGGNITKNFSANGGGGISVSGNSIFRMTGADVTDNTAMSAEGGGISINQNATGEISGGRICGNKTGYDADGSEYTGYQHWGGGGIFCANGAFLYMRDILVNGGNHAGGFGGGVAGCSTGRIYLLGTDGSAVFDNSADGVHLSGSSSYKSQDRIYAANSRVFMENGYQDYFCALSSFVSNKMLGDGYEKWSGSADGRKIEKADESDITLVAQNIMGLTADPSQSSKAQAADAAKVFITGNQSYTHGGGILCNGYLVVGTTSEISTGSRLEIDVRKILLDEDGGQINLQDWEFGFELTEEKGEEKEVFASGTAFDDGQIVFQAIPTLNTEGTYTYYLREKQSYSYDNKECIPSADVPGRVTMDTTEYKINFAVKKVDTGMMNMPDGGTIGVKRFVIDKDTVRVQKRKDPDSEWEEAAFSFTATYEEDKLNRDDVSDKLSISSERGAAFVNDISETTNVKVSKIWQDDKKEHPNVTVKLYQNGKEYRQAILGENTDPAWMYEWTKLPKVDDDGKLYSYTVEEVIPEGYEAKITSKQEEGTEERGTVWVPADKLTVGRDYLVVAENTALCSSGGDHQITAEDQSIVVKGSDQVAAGDVVYTDYYADGSIDEKSIFKAVYYSAGDNYGIKLANFASGCGILVETKDDSNLKMAGSTGQWLSSVNYSQEAGLYAGYQWNYNENFPYAIVYQDGIFGAVEGGISNVKLYVRTNMRADNGTEFVITNAPKPSGEIKTEPETGPQESNEEPKSERQESNEEPKSEQQESNEETESQAQGSGGEKKTEAKKSAEKKNGNAASTGDNTSYIRYMLMLLAAAGCIAGIGYNRKRRKRK